MARPEETIDADDLLSVNRDTYTSWVRPTLPELLAVLAEHTAGLEREGCRILAVSTLFQPDSRDNPADGNWVAQLVYTRPDTTGE